MHCAIYCIYVENNAVFTLMKHPKYPKQLLCLLPIFPVISP